MSREFTHKVVTLTSFFVCLSVATSAKDMAVIPREFRRSS